MGFDFSLLENVVPPADDDPCIATFKMTHLNVA